MEFRLVSPFEPAGDQPQAIAALTEGLHAGRKQQVLMGVTGSGKTFTMANVIKNIQKPTLVLSHNKTLAAQLYGEFKDFFPYNAVHYFVSYYDYYQPEAYIPQRDIYIEKDASINQEIDRLRLASTSALVSRRDVVIVASVSCIYGLGSPEDYRAMVVALRRGQQLDRDEMLRKLIDVQYERNDIEFARAKFRVRGDCVELWPSYEEYALRIEFWGDEIEKLSIINPTSGEVISVEDELFVYPAKHFVMPEERIEAAAKSIREELDFRLAELKDQGKLLEAQRLNARTRFDIEMLMEVGYCPGIENYSRPLSGRPPGSTPDTLFDYFPDDFLLFVDESHATVPQVRGMFAGDYSRKSTLVEHGFRLPSALDNRPLRFDEFERRIREVVYVSATPGPYELQQTGGEVVEQVIRPTGLLDPVIEISPARGQVPHLLGQIRERSGAGRARAGNHAHQAPGRGPLVLPRRAGSEVQMAAQRAGRVRARRTFARAARRALRGTGRRQPVARRAGPARGLDGGHPRCRQGGLLAQRDVADADDRRAARNVNAKVVLYADAVTKSMQNAIDETMRRRALQEAYNREHGITPETVRKSIKAGIESEAAAHAEANRAVGRTTEAEYITEEYIQELEGEMLAAAESLEFERAAALRDRISQLREAIGKKRDEVEIHATRTNRGRRRGRGSKGAGGRVPRPKRS